MDPRITDMELGRDDMPAAAQTDLPEGWIQLAKYFIGELEPGEQQVLERWLSADPQRYHTVAQARAAWEATASVEEPAHTEDAWMAVRERTGLGSSPRERTGIRTAGVATNQRKAGRFSLHSVGMWRWTTVAAMAAIVAVLIMGLHGGIERLGQHESPATSSYATGKGERATITLPDGNRVALNVDSHLDVPADYISGNHTVRLVGEGVFTVLHHDRVPFAVLAGGVTTHVLGTTFLVRHYTTDSLTTVAVQDGRVALRNVIVAAAQQVAAGRAKVGNIQRADPAQFSFTKGVLTLDGVPFTAAIAELDRWYDTDIRLGDPSLAQRRVAGEYAAGSIADLISILELTFNVRVVRDGRVLTLFPR